MIYNIFVQRLFSQTFGFLTRILLIAVVAIIFHLVAGHSYAAGWTSAGLSSEWVQTLAVDQTNQNILYAGTAVHGIFKSTDGGASWNAINNGLPDTTGTIVAKIAINPVNTNIIYIALRGAGIFKSTDGGASWTNIKDGVGPSTYYLDMAMDPSNPDTLYVAIYADCSGVWKTMDGGSTWTQSIPNCDMYGLAIDPTNTNIVYAAGHTVYKSTDGGLTWTGVDASEFGIGCCSGAVNGIALNPSNTSVLYAEAENGNIYKSIDANGSWTQLATGFSATGFSLIVDPNQTNRVYAGGNNGSYGVFESTDSGASWSNISGLPSNGVLSVVAPKNNSGVLYAATTAGLYSYNFNSLTVGAITAPSSPVLVNTTITATASFTDGYPVNTSTASWNWGDGNTTTGTVTESNGSGTVSDTHTYTSVGVYPITLTVNDNNGLVTTQTFQYVAVYDSSTSFAGVRSFDNPSGASLSTTGKVSFGISSKYSNSNVLTGSVKMSFKAANIDFASTSVLSLATSNGKAYLRGNGTVNGSGNYTFLATGIDGSVVGGNDLIRFQIKDSSGNVVYDSQSGASDTADATTPVATGNIRIH